MSVSAIVLAGGRSTRFGRDKLAEPIDGSSMLDRTIAAVRSVADDIVVVSAPGDERTLPADVRTAYDAAADRGPLAGVVAGLSAVRHGTALVVGGDMPWIRADVLLALVGALGRSADVAALEAGGRPQQLPLALRRATALPAIERLIDGGERRLGAVLDTLSVAVIAEADWRHLDPGGASLRDVDMPGDLPPPG